MKDTKERKLPTAEFWREQFCAGKDHSDREGARADWNLKSVGFVQKKRENDYIHGLLDIMPLEQCDSVFDMGCGAGALAIPLAKAGHRVCAVDFSDGMLDGLREYAEETKTSSLIDVYQRAWEDNLDDLPVCDIAISSRSLILDDLACAIEKLEAHARKFVVITLPGGSIRRYETELGLTNVEPGAPIYRTQSLTIVANYLFAMGRLPEIRYIEYPRNTKGKTPEEIIERTIKFATSDDPKVHERIAAYLREHIVEDPKTGGYKLDYDEMNRWGYIKWNIDLA